MTDLPRRAYPLVVAAPGGFEDAVRRGRGIRRRRAGGSTGAALALAGVIAYSVMQGNDLNPKGLHPTRDMPGIEQPATLPGILVEPTAPEDAPSSAPAASGPVDRVGGPVAGGGPVTGPTARPTAGPVTNVPGRPSGTPKPQPGRAYAARGEITETETPMTTEPEAECLQDQSKLWCGRAEATEVANTPEWTFRYTLCRRSIDAAPGVIEFDRKQEAEFSIVDTATGETIWTYSAGQRVVRAESTTEVAGGRCAHWTTRWNGYDDFGLTPRPGNYHLVASSTGRSDTVLPTKSDDFVHGDASA